MLNPVQAATTQPLSTPVPADDAVYRARKGPLRLAVRTVRQALQLGWSGQSRHLRHAIEPHWKRALWIHDEAPQIGDALMDLAPRSLLRVHGVAVDLLTTPTLLGLFDGDRWLGRVFDHADAIDATGYDFVIASSHARRALVRKRICAPRLPWVSLAGWYSVPDYQRAQFTTRRLADLLHTRLDAVAWQLHSRQKLDVPKVKSASVATFATTDDRPCIAIAVGGVHADRTYRHWPEVLRSVAHPGPFRIALVGSANGGGAAERIVAGAPPGSCVENHVGRLDLHATRAVLQAADLVLAADGGLMHLALTTTTPVIALFNAGVDPAWRLPEGDDGIVAIRVGADGARASDEVSEIAPELIARQVAIRLGRQDPAR